MKGPQAERKVPMRQGFSFIEAARFVLGWLGFIAAVAAVVLFVRYACQNGLFRW